MYIFIVHVFTFIYITNLAIDKLAKKAVSMLSIRVYSLASFSCLHLEILVMMID